jgi:glutamyl-tRNA synthetase
MPAAMLGERLAPYLRRAGLDPSQGPDPARVAEGYRERAQTLVEMAASCRYCYEDFEEIDPAAAKKHLRPVILEPFKDLRRRLPILSPWSEPGISRTIEECAEAFGINLGKLGQPVRVAVTGGPVSPPLDVTLALVGRERTIARLDRAIDLLEVRAAAAQ